MDTFLRDLRYAARKLARHPGFTLVTLVTLALGVGVNTALFSVINAVLLRPLPYKDSERLVTINHDYPQIKLKASVSAFGYEHYRDHAKSFENLTAFQRWECNLSGHGEPERILGMRVTTTFFRTLGVDPIHGRAFTREEGEAGGGQVAVLSYGLWQRRFGGRSSIVDNTIILDGQAVTVVGVMPADFQFGRELGAPVDIWVPILFTPVQRTPDRLTWEFLTVIGRLKPEVTVKQAQAEMDLIADNLRRQYMPQMNRTHWGLAVDSLQESLVGEIRPAFLALLGAVAFVWLIACANVANLLLVRAAARRKEIDIRAALGARRMRIVRQLLTESLLLALVAGTFGVLLAFVSVRFLTTLEQVRIPRIAEVTLEMRVLLFALGISILAGILSGLAPALHQFEGRLQETLREGGRAGTGAVSRRMRNSLVVLETALALVLLVGAGLLLKSFSRVQEVKPGFDPRGVLSFHLALPESQYEEPAEIYAFFQTALAKFEALPGVVSAGAVSTLPLTGFGSSGSFRIEGQELGPGQSAPHGARWRATSGYFNAMRIPLLRGRYFSEWDRADRAPVVLIDENLARKYFPNQNPVGRRIAFDTTQEGPRWREIVGVVGHVKHEGLEGESRVQYYLPQSQAPNQRMFVVLRSSKPLDSLAKSIPQVIHELDSSLAVARVSQMETLVENSIAGRRFTTFLLAAFALIAVGLAAVGVYGVISYSVAQRTQEIGVRMALGARTGSVLRLVLTQAFFLTAGGLLIGLAGSLALTRYMKELLFHVEPTDPVTFAAVSSFLIVVSVLACWIPARRATRVNPIIALRYE